MKRLHSLKGKIFFAVSLIFIALIAVNCVFFFSAFTASKNVALCDYEAIEIFVFGSSIGEENSTSAKITIKDMDGNDCASMERSWKGDVLSINFSVMEMNDAFYCFPYSVQSNDSSLMDLKKYYDEGDNCLLAGRSLFRQKELKRIFHFAFNPLSLFRLAYVKTKTINLVSCKPGITYGIFVDKNGSFHLQEI